MRSSHTSIPPPRTSSTFGTFTYQQNEPRELARERDAQRPGRASLLSGSSLWQLRANKRITLIPTPEMLPGLSGSHGAGHERAFQSGQGSRQACPFDPSAASRPGRMTRSHRAFLSFRSGTHRQRAPSSNTRLSASTSRIVMFVRKPANAVSASLQGEQPAKAIVAERIESSLSSERGH